MANQALFGRYLPEGVNRGNRYLLEVILGVAAANTDTMTIATPLGEALDFLPLAAQAYTSGTPTTCTPLVITSIDQVAGSLILTNSSGGAIAAGAKVVVEMVGG